LRWSPADHRERFCPVSDQETAASGRGALREEIYDK
jgi:hypothetical protein